MKSFVIAGIIAIFTSAAEVSEKLEELTAKQGVPNDSTPANTDFYWGDICPDNPCGCDDEDDCRFSWTTDDPDGWHGDTADCRCFDGPIPDPDDYVYGLSCKNVGDGQCNIMDCPSVDHCRWSYEKGDPGQFAGGSAGCRCDILP